jgi:hypothetical protein
VNNLKKLIICALALVLMAGSASAVPSWWDDSDFNRSDTVTITNESGSGQSSGTFDIFLENLNLPDHRKEVYMLLSWDTNGDDNNSISVSDVVTISYDPGPDGTMTQVVDDDTGPPFHWEYEDNVPFQPQNETVHLEYSGIDRDESLVFDYDLRTKCFYVPPPNGAIPEPSALVLLAGGLVGLIRKRRS